MCDNRSGEHPNDHGGGQHKTDVLRLQSALAQQRRDKRRLHAERAVEQGVCGQKYPEGRRSGHNVEPTAAPATRRPPSVWRRLRRRRYLAQHTPSLLPGRIWRPGRSVLADRAEPISSSKIRYRVSRDPKGYAAERGINIPANMAVALEVDGKQI